MKVLSFAATCFFATASLACAPDLAPGEYGQFRYIADVQGASPPLAVRPPRSDRDGNLYVLLDEEAQILGNQVPMYVGNRAGGWVASCAGVSLTSEDRQAGLHGFVGRGQSRIWYWTGYRIVRVAGDTGSCRLFSRRDPSSNTEILFHGVVPWIRESPSRTVAVAWMAKREPAQMYQVLLDLDLGVYLNAKKIGPSASLKVLAVGGRVDVGQGVVVFRKGPSEGPFEYGARFIDKDAETIETIAVPNLDGLDATHPFLGFLRANDVGIYAGLTSDKRLLLLTETKASLAAVEGMDAVGVHRWQGQLYVVGLREGQPVYAAIDDDGDVGRVRNWSVSKDAANLGNKVTVTDDRNLPSRQVSFSSPRSAMGASGFPFVHRDGLDEYSNGTTTWLIAGPLDQDRSKLAIAPVGVSYDQ